MRSIHRTISIALLAASVSIVQGCGPNDEDNDGGADENAETDGGEPMMCGYDADFAAFTCGGSDMAPDGSCDGDGNCCVGMCDPGGGDMTCCNLYSGELTVVFYSGGTCEMEVDACDGSGD